MHNEEPQWLQQMEPIFEILNDGVLILTDESHRILFVNTVFEEMTGIPRGEIIGRDPRQLIHGAVDYARVDAFQQKTRDRGRGREEFYLSTKGGGLLPVVVSVRIIQSPEAGRFGVVTLTDISEQKRTEVKLREANEPLEEYRTHIEQDLTLATRVQQSLAPKPVRWGGLRVDTFYQPAHRIGGDFGLVTPFKEEYLNILVCDVSGHGISSALVANRIYSETLTLLGNRLPLADLLRQLSSLVIRNVGLPAFYFTLAAARVHRSGRQVTTVDNFWNFAGVISRLHSLAGSEC